MDTDRLIQGRRLSASDVALIGSWLTLHPHWSRSRLSQELCRQWNWRNGTGQLKDMAARALLLKLERTGRIQLPPRRAGRPNERGYRPRADLAHDRSPIVSDLNALLPVQMEPLHTGDPRLALFTFLLQRYHYLGLRTRVGETISYLASDRQGRLLACLLFGAAAWKTHARDTFIGWDACTRARNLSLLTNHSRFLVLPWVRVPSLASHLLGRVCRRLGADWTQKYGHPIELVETFVQRERFRAICYRAAGWVHVGTTAGRSRNDAKATLKVPLKDIYVHPLTADFRGRLCRAPACSRTEGRVGR